MSITRDEIDTRFSDLKEYLGQRFDTLEDIGKDHEGRLRRLEAPTPSSPASSKAATVTWMSGVGTGIGALIYYVYNAIATKGTGN